MNTKEAEYDLNRDPKTNDHIVTNVINEVIRITSEQSSSSFEVPPNASPQELVLIYNAFEMSKQEDFQSKNINQYISKNIPGLKVRETREENKENKIEFIYCPDCKSEI